MVCLNQLVNANHQYRKFKELFDFEVAAKELKTIESKANYVMAFCVFLNAYCYNLWKTYQIVN
ncbi:hypothetical protein [Candidatus Tisiphia endosymbiont of Dioctria rufipes]|uniref:hypothetical protein n=1 Tax=Candidatus Tisiphia endosymbiont of Dioctria rufipes TaxID=3066255 RepID=UPI00312C9B2F